MTDPTSASTPPGTRALVRGLRILDLITQADEAPSLTRLAHDTGLDKGTTSRLLTVLLAAELIARHETRGTYHPGRSLLRLGAAYTTRLSLPAVSRPHLQQLADDTGETVHLAVRDGLDIVYVDHLPPKHAVGARAAVGQIRPLHVTAMGRAVLAALDGKARAAALTALATNTEYDHLVSDLAGLPANLEQCARRGWATVVRNDDLSRVAASISDASGRPVGAVSVSAPSYRMAGKEAAYGARCAATAAAVSSHLTGAAQAAGHRPA